jgi:hypothetical protein
MIYKLRSSRWDEKEALTGYNKILKHVFKTSYDPENTTNNTSIWIELNTLEDLNKLADMFDDICENFDYYNGLIVPNGYITVYDHYIE